MTKAQQLIHKLLEERYKSYHYFVKHDDNSFLVEVVEGNGMFRDDFKTLFVRHGRKVCYREYWFYFEEEDYKKKNSFDYRKDNKCKYEDNKDIRCDGCPHGNKPSLRCPEPKLNGG